jgi:hypothetical protein
MSVEGPTGKTVSLLVDRPMPNGATWRCQRCGSSDVELRLRTPELRLTCTHSKLIGITLQADDIAGCQVFECIDCGQTSGPSGETC